MRICPFNGCTKELPDNLFACRPHWYSLNAAKRTQINDAYGAYLDDVIGVDELRRRQQEVLGDRGDARKSD